MLKQPKIRDKAHLRWVATLPCIITGASDVQSCHIRRGTDGGIGMKPSDCYVVPLSCQQHRIQHEIGELKFWYPYGGWEKAVVLAKDLYAVTGDTPKALELIMRFRCGL